MTEAEARQRVKSIFAEVDSELNHQFVNNLDYVPVHLELFTKALLEAYEKGAEDEREAILKLCPACDGKGVIPTCTGYRADATEILGEDMECPQCEDIRARSKGAENG